jgi:hypothetical protein
MGVLTISEHPFDLAVQSTQHPDAWMDHEIAAFVAAAKAQPAAGGLQQAAAIARDDRASASRLSNGPSSDLKYDALPT